MTDRITADEAQEILDGTRYISTPKLAQTVIDQAEQIEKLKRMLDRTDAELHEYRNEFGDL